MNIPEPTIYEYLLPFGGAVAQIKLCTEPLSAFDYSDITTSVRPLPIEAIIEFERKPVLYIIRESLFDAHAEQNIQSICQRLACRGEQSFFAIVKPGILEMYPCLLDDEQPITAIQIKADSKDAPSLIYNLGQGLPPRGLEKAHTQMRTEKLRKAIFSIFINAGEKIRSSRALTSFSDDAKTALALSLIGRALFMRFLLDRGLIHHGSDPHLFSEGNPEQQWFSSVQSAAQICAWLDNVFNGDLLPFPTLADIQTDGGEEGYANYFSKLIKSDPVFLVPLADIIVGEKNNVQHVLWRQLDFSHIPVGLLSEAYDYFIHKFSPSLAKKQSTHFTPRHIAETVVEHAFEAMPLEKRASAKILDPAAGAGIFLILGFRRLAKEHLRQCGTIDTATIRKILYEYVHGFDINPHALSLATLALYLTAIEIDPKPDPVTKLRFPQKLIGHVLHDVSQIHGTLGSLASNNPKQHENKYDIIFGNPPWTRKKGDKELADITNTIARRVLTARISDSNNETVQRLLSEALAKTDNYSAGYMPDIPFFWRALEFAKPDAVIAFVTHARILFRTQKYALEAREALFRAMRVTAIVNCSDLRKENGIWPYISAQFCFIFARNTPALPNDQFRYLSPYVEKALNDNGRIRIDPAQSVILSPFEIESKKTIFKMLFRGTMLDVSVCDKIISNKTTTRTTIKKYCDKMDLDYGEGYGLKGQTQDITFLRELDAKHLNRLYAANVLDEDSLDDFNDADIPTMRRPRRTSLYAPPLVLLTKASPPKAFVYSGKKHLIFSKLYIGFSAKGHPRQDEFVSYLALLFNSSLPRYFALIQSSQFGIERDTLLVDDIYDLPFIPVETLQRDDRLCLQKLVAKINAGTKVQATDIDNFIFKLYGLDTRDAEIIYDTLTVHFPGAHHFLAHPGGAQQRSQAHPTGDDINAFCDILKGYIVELTTFYKKQISYTVQIIPHQPLAQWLFIDISLSTTNAITEHFYSEFAQSIADNEGATQIILHLADGTIRLGKLAQYRYWTRSQARILGHQLLSALCESWKRQEGV